MRKFDEIVLKEVEEPFLNEDIKPVLLSEKTMQERFQKTLNIMEEEYLDAMVIYCDLEHGSNFEYLTGFLTRFEEALMVVHKEGRAYLLLGNENLNKASKSRIPVKAIHVPFFSLPNQPMDDECELEDYLKKAGLTKNMKTGVVGWKYFTSKILNNRKLFDIPYYLVTALQNVVGEENLENRCDLFIGSKKGIRTTNNANEIAHYEFGSTLAGVRILNTMNLFDEGVSEMELGSALEVYGQPHNVVTIAATGKRFEYANLYPTDKKVKKGDAVSLTVGYKGGLSSRAGYAVNNQDELPNNVQDYIDVLARPYYTAVVTWLENIHVDMKGKELYDIIEEVLPKSEYHWHLNPGHLIADEEWMSSPIYPESEEILKSGMMLQIDIIPGQDGYAGASCESGIVLADSDLREKIKAEYPKMYERFMKRRQYMKEILGIAVHEDVLLMNDTVAYYRPYFLNKKVVFAVEK